jgi:hypothetical protein
MLRQSIRQWTLLGLLLILVSLLGISPQSKAQEGPEQTFQIKALSPVPGQPYMDSATGAVRLNRTRNELWGSVHVTDLDPNSAFTIWAAIFNRPEACITNPAGPVHCGMADLLAMPNPARASAFNVGAFVTGSVPGTANVSVHIRSGAPPDGAFILFGEGGLNDNGVRPGIHEGNGFGAEVHLVIRAHGPIIAAMISDQLSKLNGGCPPNIGSTCSNVQVATFPRVKD